MCSQQGRVVCVVALPSEAKTIVTHWKLKKLTQKAPFAIYCSQDQVRWLIVTGIGKLACSVAVGYLAQLIHSSSSDAWFNFGIAGSGGSVYGKV